MTDTTRDIAAAIRREVIPEGAKRLGLVIGIDRYQDARLNLRCARADAEAMRTLMLDPECGLFDADNVAMLADEDATRERIWRALAGLRRKAHKHDSVWIFYAGHGAPEGEDFFWVPHDGDVDDLYSTGLSRRDLNRVLDDIHAQRIVAFMDCCHAAAMAAQKEKTRAVMTAEAAFAAYQGRGRLIFAASDGREKSVEIANEGRGAFSYFLERGLRGEADHSRSGIVTADALWQYLKDKVSAAAQSAGNPQTPVRIGEETHDFALSLNPLEFGRRKRLSEAIKAMVGTEADQLTTEEGRICLDLLRRGASTTAECDLLEAMDSFASGNLRIALFRRLVNPVGSMNEAGQGHATKQEHKPPSPDSSTASEQSLKASSCTEAILLASNPQEVTTKGKCKTCGRDVDVSWKSCPACGETLKTRCASCGQSVIGEQDFCTSCGAAVSEFQVYRKLCKVLRRLIEEMKSEIGKSWAGRRQIKKIMLAQNSVPNDMPPREMADHLSKLYGLLYDALGNRLIASGASDATATPEASELWAVMTDTMLEKSKAYCRVRLQLDGKERALKNLRNAIDRANEVEMARWQKPALRRHQLWAEQESERIKALPYD